MATMKMTDLKFLVRSTLLEDADVSAIVGDKVHGAHQMDADIGTVPMPLIIVTFDSGVSLYNSEVGGQNFALWAYSRQSQDEAAELYDVAYAALQGCRLFNTNISMAGLTRETQRPDEGYNDVITSWYARGRWVAHIVG